MKARARRGSPALRLLAPPVYLLLSACSGGSGGSPSEPPPTPLLQAAGDWQGYEEVAHATPEGNCLADAHNANRGVRGQYVAHIQQSGAAVDVVLEFTGNGQTESFAGTVTASTLDATSVSPPRESDFDCRGMPTRIRTAGSRLVLTGDSRELSGTLTGDQELVDPATGAVLSRITLEEIASFSR